MTEGLEDEGLAGASGAAHASVGSACESGAANAQLASTATDNAHAAQSAPDLAKAEPATVTLTPSFHPVVSLTANDRQELFDLYARYYTGMSEATFHADLAAKDVVLRLTDSQGTLQGFSTLAVWEAEHQGRPIRVLYSGDTIIARAWWGTQALALNWIAYAGRLKAERPELPLFWFLIVKGHRTYRFLPTFAVEFHPDWRRPTPADAQALMDRLAADKFGPLYDPASGVVRCDSAHGHLAADWVEPTPRERGRADVAYFEARNPGYREGHELVCLCELSEQNLKPIARRWFAHGAALGAPITESGGR